MYEYYNSGSDNLEKDQTYANRQISQEALKAQAKMEKKAKAKKFWGKVGTGLCVGLAFGVIAGFSFAGVTRAIDYLLPQKNSAQSAVVEDNNKIEKVAPKPDAEEVKKVTEKKEADEDRHYNANSARIGMDVSDIVENSMPSIVAITNKSVQEVRSMFGMGVQQYESKSAGSGIIIGQSDEELLIATNNHVISGANTLSVCFVDDEAYSAYVKGGDADLDLAVVAVKISDLSSSTKDKIKIARIGDSEKLLVGEQVVAIGNALGYGQSVTTGIVSAVDRDMTDDNVDNPLIQTDAAINPGNSGGALINMDGELIGINCAKISSTAIEGVGYAIPMASANPIIEKLMNREIREEVDAKDAGYIGISGVAVDKNTSSMYGIPEGVYIQNVEENSPAEDAGLVKSDVIRKFDGVTVSSISDIRENLNYYRAGEEVELVIYRAVDGEYVEKSITITLGDREGTPLDPKNLEGNNSDSDEQNEDDSDEEYIGGYNNGDSIENFIIGGDPFSMFGFGN